jgi:hypothetical protein
MMISLSNGNKENGKKCEMEPCEPSYNMSISFYIKPKWKNTQKSPIYNETKQTQSILRGRWSVCWRLRVLMDVYLRHFIAVYDVP